MKEVQKGPKAYPEAIKFRTKVEKRLIEANIGGEILTLSDRSDLLQARYFEALQRSASMPEGSPERDQA